MQYYQVVFPKQRSPIMNVFTYHSEQKLNIGDCITAPLRNKVLHGIVIKKVSKPTFKTRSISEIFYKNMLSEKQIQLFFYIVDFYFANPPRTISLFTPKNIEKVTEETPDRIENPEKAKAKVKESIKTTPPKFALNETQKKVLAELNDPIQQEDIHLIHGITGSGKTILYLKKAEQVLKQGKQVLILIPEISLTPQTIKIFEDYFPKDIISLYHSKLNPTEQTTEWVKIRNQKSKIIIGSRSSLFLPFQNLGLIIMDEEHDNAYKQDQNPRYHARTILQWYNQNLKIPVILGSATPSLETFLASQNTDRIHKYEIFHRSQNQPLPEIEIVDLKEELAKGNPNQISDKLFQAIQEKLKLKEQVLLLHNKRGFANYLTCVDCGSTIDCHQCSISLTVHKYKQGDTLVCHYCDHHQKAPATCPTCSSPQLKTIGKGIQQITEELTKLFPTAKILRVDSDTTSRKNAHAKVYKSIQNKEYDIIIGTQMVATGLDIPNINLVGITNADIALNMPDFRASERAFQLLTQVAGRCGRRETQGKVIIQTFNPEHPVIQAVKNYNLEKFYTDEAAIRQDFHYPPYTKLLKLTCSHKDLSKLTAEIQKVEQVLKQQQIPFKSAPALIHKKSNKYYHNILINTLNPQNILANLNLSPDWWIDRDPTQTI